MVLTQVPFRSDEHFSPFEFFKVIDLRQASLDQPNVPFGLNFQMNTERLRRELESIPLIMRERTNGLIWDTHRQIYRSKEISIMRIIIAKVRSTFHLSTEQEQEVKCHLM